MMNNISIESMLEHAQTAINTNSTSRAYALLRSINCLQHDYISDEQLDTFRFDEARLLTLPPATYLRHKRIADILYSLGADSNSSVIDVGGGGGLLAQFLPDLEYFLCEPKTNSLYSHDVYDAGLRFDYVVCVHVLEHIQKEKRKEFIESLFSLADKELLLVAPVDIEGLPKKTFQEILYQHTRAEWALEHIQCTLPSIDEVREISESIARDVEDHPGSNFLPSVLAFFMNHMASQHKDEKNKAFYNDIKKFINTNYHLFQSDKPSGDHIFILHRG